MRAIRPRRFFLHLACLAILALPPSAAPADEKFVQLQPMQERSGISVNADGSRVTIIGNDYLVFNEKGEQLKTVGIFHWGTGVIRMVPLPDGRAISCTRGLNPHVDMMRADGSTMAALVSAGGDDRSLHGDINWSSPHDMAVDIKAQRIFVLEETHPDNSGGAHTPDPQWVRIGMWDFAGKYLGDVFRYDAKAADAARQDRFRINTINIAVDADRQRLYLTYSDRNHDKGTGIMAFDYSGKLLAQATVGLGWDNGNIAVLGNGNLVCSYGGDKQLQVFSPELKPLPPIAFPSAYVRDGSGPRVRQLAVDRQGRLYASVYAPEVIFMRWSADMAKTDVFTIKHLWVCAAAPDSAEAGKPFVIPATASGDPQPEGREWTVMARPSDGRSLQWRHLPAVYDDKQLTVSAPADFRGLYDLVVRYGQGEIAQANRENDPFVKRMVLFTPQGAKRSVAVITANGRRAFRQGEAIALQIVCRSAAPKPATVALRLLDDCGAEVQSAAVPVDGAAAVEIPAAFSGRLLPGSYTLAPQADGYASYPLALDIAAGYRDSPMQRILYQEYGFSGVSGAVGYPDAPQRMNYLRDYFAAVKDWGFTRVTDRMLLNTNHGRLHAWRRDDLGLDLNNPALAPVEYYDVVRTGYEQENDFYLDRAVANGIVHDSHLANHCESLRFRDFWLQQKDADLQRFVQWAGKYPAHYGVNYHDEGFWGDWDSSWSKADEDWLAAAKAKLGSPNDAWRYALDTGYESYNRAVHEANPNSKVTCTPMWQGGLSNGTYAPMNFKRMSESFTHYLGEGTQQPWYVLHSLESFRRPGLPLMGVVDNAHHGSGGEIVMKNMMLSLSRGVQGVGVSFTAPLDGPGANEDALGADVYRVVNRLAKWYGPILAETTPMNEAAVLYSTTQAGTEKGQSWDAPHWGAVYGMLSGLMMAGVPANMVYEEDVRAGWLLAGGRPRYPMLFLVGQKAPLPPPVDEAVRKYAATGGRVFADADSGNVSAAVKLPFSALIPAGEGFANDSCFITLAPRLEALAVKLKKAVAQYRGFPLDTDDPWISRGLFDAGALRYVMLAAETRPFPWYGGLSYSFGLTYTRTVQPRTVALAYPATAGVVYDVFEHQIVQPQQQAAKAHLAVNLRQFSGRLYALAPEPLAAPAVTATVQGDQLTLSVQAVGKSGRSLAAQVPLRIRLFNSQKQALEQYRGTARDGSYRDSLTLPPGNWTLEVTEMLGGNVTTGELAVTAPLPALYTPRPQVEIVRQGQLEQLLTAAKTGGLTLVLPSKDFWSRKKEAWFSGVLATNGIKLAPDKPLLSEPKADVLLAIGYPPAGNTLGALLENVRNMGLAPLLISPNVPGPGRGFIAPIYAPRGYGENVIALVGGDAAGLGKTVEAFCDLLARTAAAPAQTRLPGPVAADVGVPCRPAAPAALPKLADMVGPRFSVIASCQNSPYLAVAARGFGKNLALVKDLGTSGQVVSTQRVGASPRNESLYVSPDGRFAGLSARELPRCGEAFHLLDAGKQTQTVFAAFGDMAAQYHHFAASSDGNYVMAVGTYGVVCWKREKNGWKEAWADEYWKSFDKLTWPISDTDERIPTFHAYIPEGADYAIVVFSETADNGWVTPDHHYKASLAAYGLTDGCPRWRFDIPIPDAQLFPSLFSSRDGRNLLVKVQNGSWTAVSYCFYNLDAASGALKGTPRTSKEAPINLAVGNGEGLVAAAFAGRNIEVRKTDGSMLFSQLWSGGEPVSLAFSNDGQWLYVADDAGRLTSVGPDGHRCWQARVGAVSQLAVSGTRIYAAGWDGRVRAFAADGALCWMLDCTPAMDAVDPLAEVLAASQYDPKTVVAAQRPSSAGPETPPGEDLIASGLASLSGEKLEGEFFTFLQAGKAADAGKPAVAPQQLFQDMLAGQQAQFLIEFPRPTDVGTLTVQENTRHPESYPTDSFIGVWDEANKQWVTVKRGVFLGGPVSTYVLNLKAVKKLIYCPWNNYGHNFYTTRIEVRPPNSRYGYEEDFDKLHPGPIDGQDFWQGKSEDKVVPNPAGGQMLRVFKQAQRPNVFTRDPAYVKQVVSFDFLLQRTINDPAFAVTQGVKQLFHGFVFAGPDPDQTFRFGYEGARNPQGAWINALRVENHFGPNTLLPGVWYRAELTLDRQAGTFDLRVTERASGRLYWHSQAVPCGKLNAGQRGMNLIQFNAANEDSDKGGFSIDNLRVTVANNS